MELVAKDHHRSRRLSNPCSRIIRDPQGGRHRTLSANDRTLLDDLAWRAADTPSKALGVVRSILRQRCTAATQDHRAIVEAMERLLSATLAPLLAASRGALVDALDKITGREASRLRDAAHAIERHVIAFRGAIDLTQAELDRVASSLLATAPQVPRDARGKTGALYAEVLYASRSRLPGRDVLASEARRSAGSIAAVLDRQAFDLRATVAALENMARRRLSDELVRLSAAATTAQALDVNAVLARGYVLPLDPQRRIIRSAKTARTAGGFDLLFTDGRVACRPVTV